MHLQELNNGEVLNGHPLANIFVQCQQYVSNCVCKMKPEWRFPLPCSLSVRRSRLLWNFLTSLALPLEGSALTSYVEFCCWCIKYGAEFDLLPFLQTLYKTQVRELKEECEERNKLYKEVQQSLQELQEERWEVFQFEDIIWNKFIHFNLRKND